MDSLFAIWAFVQMVFCSPEFMAILNAMKSDIMPFYLAFLGMSPAMACIVLGVGIVVLLEFVKIVKPGDAVLPSPFRQLHTLLAFSWKAFTLPFRIIWTCRHVLGLLAIALSLLAQPFLQEAANEFREDLRQSDLYKFVFHGTVDLLPTPTLAFDMVPYDAPFPNKCLSDSVWERFWCTARHYAEPIGGLEPMIANLEYGTEVYVKLGKSLEAYFAPKLTNTIDFNALGLISTGTCINDDFAALQHEYCLPMTHLAVLEAVENIVLMSDSTVPMATRSMGNIQRTILADIVASITSSSVTSLAHVSQGTPLATAGITKVASSSFSGYLALMIFTIVATLLIEHKGTLLFGLLTTPLRFVSARAPKLMRHDGRPQISAATGQDDSRSIDSFHLSGLPGALRNRPLSSRSGKLAPIAPKDDASADPSSTEEHWQTADACSTERSEEPVLAAGSASGENAEQSSPLSSGQSNSTSPARTTDSDVSTAPSSPARTAGSSASTAPSSPLSVASKGSSAITDEKAPSTNMVKDGREMPASARIAIPSSPTTPCSSTAPRDDNPPRGPSTEVACQLHKFEDMLDGFKDRFILKVEKRAAEKVTALQNIIVFMNEGQLSKLKPDTDHIEVFEKMFCKVKTALEAGRAAEAQFAKSLTHKVDPKFCDATTLCTAPFRTANLDLKGLLSRTPLERTVEHVISDEKDHAFKIWELVECEFQDMVGKRELRQLLPEGLRKQAYEQIMSVVDGGFDSAMAIYGQMASIYEEKMLRSLPPTEPYAIQW